MTTPSAIRELEEEIRSIKKALGNKLFIAAHHYQRGEVVAISDCIGDSYRLAVESAKTSARYILLCGVRFMAESAAILARENQMVISPDLRAGCPMADMINLPLMLKALEQLDGVVGRPVVPLTYMNSYAEVKALTGERGGAICTSSNAEELLSYYIARKEPVFFSPDFNLGINTARRLGFPLEKIFKIDRQGSLSALKGESVASMPPPAEGLLFLWDGYCHVHKAFTVADVERVRTSHPGIKVLVHPECDPEVVAASDGAGSTEWLYRMLRAAPAGSSWAIGTELNFVYRAAAELPEKKIIPLRESLCPNMARIGLEEVLKALRRILDYENDSRGVALPVVSVAPLAKNQAKAALSRMIELTEG